MACMYQRNGRWYAKWYEGGTIKRRRLRTKSKQRARAKRVGIEAALAEHDSVDQKSDMEIEEFTKAYLQHIEGIKRPYTVKSLRHYWTYFVEWADPIQLTILRPMSSNSTNDISYGKDTRKARCDQLFWAYRRYSAPPLRKCSSSKGRIL